MKLAGSNEEESEMRRTNGERPVIFPPSGVAATPSRYVAVAGASIEEKVAPGSRTAAAAASAFSTHFGADVKAEQLSQARPGPLCGMSPSFSLRAPRLDSIQRVGDVGRSLRSALSSRVRPQTGA